MCVRVCVCLSVCLCVFVCVRVKLVATRFSACSRIDEKVRLAKTVNCLQGGPKTEGIVFIARQRDIDIANLSVCPFVRP